MDKRQRWHLHCCALDRECRNMVGMCWRVELNSPWFHLGVALRPDSKFAQLDGGRWTSFRRW